SKAKKNDTAKESARWAIGASAASARLRGRASVIHVMDREGDAYPLMAGLRASNERFVIRAFQERVVFEDGNEEDAVRLREALDKAEEHLEVEIPLSRRGKTKAPYPS